MKLDKNWIPQSISYSAFEFSNQSGLIFEGNGYEISGQNKVAHLFTIGECQNFVVRNITFRGGNTEVLRRIPRRQIPNDRRKKSIFEVIDGGAVVISGNCSVTFENCRFIANSSIMCGGAVSNQSKSKVIFKNCLFKDNIAGHTGSAIDNLTRDSNIEVEDCKFIDNVSNIWHKYGYPHGQISLFPKTRAVIKNSSFIGGSMPFDYYASSDIELENNTYSTYEGWDENTICERRRNFVCDNLLVVMKMYWVIPKTFGKVFYRVNC